MIPCESVQFAGHITIDRDKPRTSYQTDADTQVFWSEQSGQVAIVAGGKTFVVVPPPGSVIRGVRLPAEEKPNGQQPTAPSDSPAPARSIPARGRVQR